MLLLICVVQYLLLTAVGRRNSVFYSCKVTNINSVKLTLSFRSIYKNTSKDKAITQFNQWKETVQQTKIDKFNTALNSIDYHLDNIMNFFNNRSTNANAESFNSKIKGFRANLGGVTDIKFFLFRLEKLFA